MRIESESTKHIYIYLKFVCEICTYIYVPASVKRRDGMDEKTISWKSLNKVWTIFTDTCVG